MILLTILALATLTHGEIIESKWVKLGDGTCRNSANQAPDFNRFINRLGIYTPQRCGQIADGIYKATAFNFYSGSPKRCIIYTEDLGIQQTAEGAEWVCYWLKGSTVSPTSPTGSPTTSSPTSPTTSPTTGSPTGSPTTSSPTSICYKATCGLGPLSFPEHIYNICVDAFNGCTGFNGTLIIPDSVISIGANAFNGTGFTGRLYIPNSVTSIGANAFNGCTGFNGTLIIPDSVTSIGANAFTGTGFNGSLYIPNSVRSISANAFSGIIGSICMSNPKYYTCCGVRRCGVVPIYSSVSATPDEACNNDTDCRPLTDSVCSPYSGSYNRYGAMGHSFCKCRDMSYSDGNGYRDSDDCFDDQYCSYDYTCKAKLCKEQSCYNTDNRGALTIADIYHSGNPYCIAENGFTGCNYNGKLTLYYSIVDIGKNAFKDLRGLTGNLVLPTSVVSIGESAFEGCIGFDGPLYIPDSVVTIGANAFKGCSGFSGTLIVHSTDTIIYANAFQGCTGLSCHTIAISNMTTIFNSTRIPKCTTAPTAPTTSSPTGSPTAPTTSSPTTSPTTGSPTGSPTTSSPTSCSTEIVLPSASCSASSEYPGNYNCERAFDADPDTEWATYHEGTGSWIQTNFGASYQVGRFEYRHRLYNEDNREITLSFSDGSSQKFTLENGAGEYPRAVSVLQSFALVPVQTTFVKLTVDSVYETLNNGAREIHFYGCTSVSSSKVTSSAMMATASVVSTLALLAL